jgi:hypothetical protein
MRPLLLTTGQGSARLVTEASGPSAADASGLSSVKAPGLCSPASATTAAPSPWSKTGKSGMTRTEGARGGDTSAISTSTATGGTVGAPAVAPTGIDVGVGVEEGGLKAAAASTASPGTMAAPTGGSTWEACPMAAHASWAPRWRAPCAEANQPAWRAAAPAEEADPVLRAFMGARPAKPCLRFLKGRKDKIKIHRKMAETRVPSDTYSLRGRANCACGETSRTPASADAAEGWPAAGFDAASASDARGAEGGLPGRCHDSRGNNFPHGWRGHLLLGGLRVSLITRATPIISAKGSSTPSARLRSLDWDPGVPTPNTGGASPPGGWLDDPWPSLGSGLRPSRPPCRRPRRHHHHRRRRACPVTAPTGARPFLASDDASPRLPELASSRELGPFPRIFSAYPSPRRAYTCFGPPRPPGLVAGRF